MDLVDYLSKAMSDKDLIPADITRLSGLSASQVSKILGRKSPAGLDAIECFAIALDVDFNVLYRLSKNLPMPPENDARRNELVRLYDKAKENSREDIIDYAKMRVEKDKREESKSGKRDRIA